MNYTRLTLTTGLRNLFRHCAPRKREGEHNILAAARTLAPNYTTQFSSLSFPFPFFNRANINSSNNRLHNVKLKSPQLNRQLSDDMTFCFWDRGEKYKDHFEPGVYVCSKCGYELFSSRQKYNHHSPWPAFTETVHEDSVSKRAESRTALKVSCGKCGNPLGHEFLGDGPKGGSRF